MQNFILVKLTEMDVNIGGAPGSKSIAKFTKCGCMATLHGLVGSCTGCGRIVCARETDSTCPFCCGIVFPPLSAEDIRHSGADLSTIKAYELKVSSRSRTQRVVVFIFTCYYHP